MTTSWPPQPRRPVRQAALWSARLRSDDISLADVKRFRAWYLQPANRAAFLRLRAVSG